MVNEIVAMVGYLFHPAKKMYVCKYVS
jgi:hypothetical protein